MRSLLVPSWDDIHNWRSHDASSTGVYSLTRGFIYQNPWAKSMKSSKFQQSLPKAKSYSLICILTNVHDRTACYKLQCYFHIGNDLFKSRFDADPISKWMFSGCLFLGALVGHVVNILNIFFRIECSIARGSVSKARWWFCWCASGPSFREERCKEKLTWESFGAWAFI